MKKIRKITSFFLVLLFTLVPITSLGSSNFDKYGSIPKYSEITPLDEGNNEYIYLGSETERNVRIGYHPDFKKTNKVSFYYFSSSDQMNFSISGTYGAVTGQVDISTGSSSGYGIEADPNRWSRPCIFGDVEIHKYRLIVKDAVGNEISSYIVTRPVASRTYIKAVYN